MIVVTARGYEEEKPNRMLKKADKTVGSKHRLKPVPPVIGNLQFHHPAKDSISGIRESREDGQGPGFWEGAS
jgi:hypothetical protein